MKKSLIYLVFSCLGILMLSTSCRKATRIHQLSAHTWVATQNYYGGLAGDEYTFHDNRLFFKKGVNSNYLEDGRWQILDNYYGDYQDQISIETDTRGYQNYTITKLTDKELELSYNNNSIAYFIAK